MFLTHARSILVVWVLVAALGCKKKETAAPAPSETPPPSVSDSANVAETADAMGVMMQWAGGSAGDEGLPDEEPSDAATDKKPLGRDVMDREHIGGIKIGMLDE